MQAIRTESLKTKIKLKIGDYEICPIPTGLFGLDGGAMFGTVPKVLWEKSNPADEKNRILMEARSLLLKSSNRKILIDCGNGSDFKVKYGEKLGAKFSEMYNIDKESVSLQKSLSSYGLNFSDITDVVFTHLHFDHCGGGTTEKNGKIVPTFSNARYYLQKANLETASHPNIRERSSYFSANYQPLIDSEVLNILEGNVDNFLPGISAIVSNGHTGGHQMIKVSDGAKTLLYCGDVVPTSSHIRLAWLMGYDLDPLTLIEEKKKILSLAADNKWYLYFEHDPYCDAALIARNGNDFSVLDLIDFAG